MPADFTKPQLFLDDTWIEDSFNVGRCWHPLEKFPEPILKAEFPWEAHCPVMYGSVHDWGGSLHMWYCNWNREFGSHISYARSEDGVLWTKPRLGLVEMLGSRDNNVLVAPEAGGLVDDLTVIADPEDARQPLKMLFWQRKPSLPEPNHQGIWLSGSDDGIHWSEPELVLPEWGDRFNALPHKHDGRYILLGRAPRSQTRDSPYSRGYHGRVVWRIESEDLRTWSEPTCVITGDVDDPLNMQIYSATAFEYGDLLMGTIERMHMTPDYLDSEWIWSRDAGRSWRRARTRPSIMPWGVPGMFDSRWINLSASPAIERHGRLWFYYSGRTGAHGAVYPHLHGAIGLATLRRDGFASVYSQQCQGRLVMPVLTWPGGDLGVNVDPRRDLQSHPRNQEGGSLRASITDAQGESIAGYGVDDCPGVTQNSRGAMVPLRWNDGRSLDALAGRAVQITWHLHDAHLYAFAAVPVGDGA